MKFLLTLLLLVTTATSAGAVGTHEDITVYCPSLGVDRSIRVYLPDGYDDTSRAYPVGYFLHGWGYQSTFFWWDYFNVTTRLNAMIASGTIPPMIFVMPDGLEDHYDGCWYSNSDLYGLFEDYVAIDLVQYIDLNYRTIAAREQRVIFGHSMGGYGTMNLALKYPELFGGTASLAGVVDLRLDLEIERYLILADTTGPPPYDWSPENGQNTLIMFSKAGAWSPNLSNPPYFVDFPYDENGDIDEAVMARWKPHDPPRLASEYAATSSSEYPLYIWIGCGSEDELLPMSEALADSMEALGLPFDLVIYGGGHLVLPLETVLPDLVNAVVDVEEAGGRANVAMRVRPNPSRSHSLVDFVLPQAESATLIVYDISGRIVRSVFDGPLAAGPHSLTWGGKSDAGNRVADGVYFVALRTETGTEVMRTVRLK